MPRITNYTWMLEGLVPAADRTAFQNLWRAAFRNAGFPDDWANNAFDVALSMSGTAPAQAYYFRMPMQKSMFFQAIVLVAARVGREVPFDRDDDPDDVLNSQIVQQFIDFLRTNHNIRMRLRRNDQGNNEPQLNLVLSQTGLQLIQPEVVTP